MKFAILGVLIILSIAFLVVLWKAAKFWRWYQIVPALFTMVLAIVFVFPTATVLKSRSKWHQLKEQLEVQAEQVSSEQLILKYGDRSDASAGEGLLDLSQRMSKLAIEAGRRWRGLRLQNQTPDSIVLSAPPAAVAVAPGIPADDDAAAAPAPAGPLVPAELIVYGFAEGRVANSTSPVPLYYLGEFRVTASNANQITIKPIATLEPGQLQQISSGQATSWSLYEMLPLDGHEPFLAEGSEENEDNRFGRVDDVLVKSLLGNKVRDETLQSYLRDGQRATDDDPPASRWMKIEFTEKHSIDVDSTTQQAALDGGFFDASGRAIDTRLQRGGEDGSVKFVAGDLIYVKEEAGKHLIEIGKARLVDNYYVRPLNDYRVVLRRLRLRLTESQRRKEKLNFEQQQISDAIAATVKMIEANQDEKLKGEQDFGQLQAEVKAVTEFLKLTQQGLDKTRDRSRQLYLENQRLEQEIRQLHAN